MTLGIKMNRSINFKKIWNDEDTIELKVEVSDGDSIFSNKVYIGIKEIENLIKQLQIFRGHVYGGIYDIIFGEFGPEYANGGFQARLHFNVTNKINITTSQQTEFKEFSKNNVASEAKMHLKTEPILLDNFINDLKKLNSDSSDEASLECIEYY